MVSEAYELLSLFMRYIFIGLGVLILFRAYRWMRRDSRAYKKQMRALPDAGLVGEIVDLQSGKSQPLPREGTMGASRNCDIRIKGAGVARRHVRFAFEEGKGMKITPCRGAAVFMAGVELRGSAHALHGTQLQLGEAFVRVRLFAGLNVPQPAQFQADMPWQENETGEWEEEAMPFSFRQPFAPMGEEEEEAAPLRGFAPPPMAFDPQGYGMEAENSMPAGEMNPGYPENGDEAGQPPYPYAPYPGEEMPNMPPAQNQPGGYPFPEEAGEDEAVPYQSPVSRRRRRSRL